MWNFNKLLGCSGFSVIKCSSDDKHVFFHLKRRRKTAVCPKCFKRTKAIYDHAPERKLKHGTILGKICTIFFRTRRFYCVYCRAVFVEETNIAPKYQGETLKHKKEVVFNLQDRSFLSGTRKYNVSYHAQRKWLREIVSSSVFDFSIGEKEAIPFVLGIDEVSFSGHKTLTTVGNITKHRLKGVMTSKNKEDLKYLAGFRA